MYQNKVASSLASIHNFNNNLPPACTTVSFARNPPEDVFFKIRSTLDLSLEKMYRASGLSLQPRKNNHNKRKLIIIIIIITIIMIIIFNVYYVKVSHSHIRVIPVINKLYGFVHIVDVNYWQQRTKYLQNTSLEQYRVNLLSK